MKTRWLLIIVILVGCIALTPASALDWVWNSGYGGYWNATDGTYSYLKINATGTHNDFNFTDVVALKTPEGYIVNATFEYLLVGGGAGAGDQAGGGGGGGGVIYNITPSQHTTTFIVGAGGAKGTSGYAGNDGGDSYFPPDTAYGGGGGGGAGIPNGRNGGSGGGGRSNGIYTGGSGVTGQGYGGAAVNASVGAGGGGGGGQNGTMGSTGYIGGKGGDGYYSNIAGEWYYYGSGGGGGSNVASTGSAMGGSRLGGGVTNVGNETSHDGESGYGGGGGGGGDDHQGGNGGGGVFIVRFGLVPEDGAIIPPVPSFTSDVTSGYSPLAVQFNDTSVTDPTAWNWSFTNVTPGNNTAVWWSQLQNATQTFGAGNWNIHLNVTNASGYNVSTADYWVNVSNPSIAAAFSGTPLSGYAGTEVTFTDETTGDFVPDSWEWNFGDGNASSDQNPAHTYDFNGNFDVNLTVYNSSAGYNSLVKSGYVTISDSGGLSGWNRQDILMEGVYTLQIEFKDSSTHNPIPAVTVIDSNGYNTTTTVGIFTNTYNYSVVVIYYSATGYVSGSRSYVMDEDRSATVYLTAAIIPFNASPATVQSYPKYVTFHVKQGWGESLDEVLVEMTPVSTSTGDWDWLATILGVDLGEVPLNTNAMNQTTDSLGTATFYIFPTAKYNVTFTKAGYTIPPMILVPRDDHYVIYATSADTTYFRNGRDELSAVNITITQNHLNSSYTYLNLTYLDTSAGTTGGTIAIWQKSSVPYGTASLIASWPVTGNSFTNSTGITHVQRVSGIVQANVTHSTFGTILRSYPFQLNSVPVEFLGFGDEIQLLVALGMMLFTAMLAGATHARQIIIVVGMEGVFFQTFGWFSAMVTRGVPNSAIWLAISVMFLYGILANFAERKRRGI